MSGQLKNNTGERKLRVTLLSAEWKASRNGDLTTINRELAIQMAKHPNVEVSVFLPQCSEEDRRDADSYNVKLIEAVKLFGFEPVDWLASLPDGHAMDCVLGHGVALGRQIQIIKKNPNYRHCKWIQVVHTAPEEIGMYKSISEGQQMQQTEIELCEMADQVVTIGPKLTGAYKCQLREQDVFNLTPSIFTEFSDEQQASDERRKFCVLVTESGDSEDFDVKGYGIAAKAIANLKGEPYQLKFASKQRGQEDELKHKLLQCGIDSNQLIISSFDESRKTSANLFSMVDIAILPSKTEGFGLSALKAISAGLPVLVSGNSGIAEALRGVPTGSQCIVDSEDPADWARAIKAVCNKKRNVRLAEAKILRENYLQQFSWKEPCAFLVEKICNLAFGGELNITVGVEDSKPEEQNMQTGMLVTESVRYQEVQPPRASATSAVSGSVSYSQREHFEVFEKEIFLSIAGNYLQTTPPQSPEERNRFKEYMKEMRLIITGVSVGSLVITVKCESLMILEELWTDYSSGRLGEVVQNCFVTEKILKELNLAELRLKTTIDVEEYNACKLFFEKDALRDALSSEFHSTSSTSESPPKKEQWEKSEQKTKIMETGKLEGTSPLTVVPTTGHGKELKEPWERKVKMASAVAPSFRSTKETTNFARLCRLLGFSVHILRETFDKRRPTGDLNAVLSSPPVHAVLQSLRKRRVLSPLQWGKLYPAIKSAVSSKNFDFNLLMVLLRNVCSLVPPANGWDTLPPETDTTFMADIVRIKHYRIMVFGHASEASVDDPTFNQYWQDIQDALVRLGGAGYQSAIDDLKKECMDPDIEEHYKELLKQWVVDEISIKERLDEMREQFGKRLDELKEAITNPKKRAGDKDALSSEFHSTSSTSESPQKKEQWKKSEQKTKIMETVKLEGTSPLTVVPITGHGKELREPWGRKGKMASAVAPSFRSTKETTNYARLCRLLENVSAHILRETFDKRRPTGDLHTVLSSPPVHAVLQSLRKKRILSPLQWGKLYPAIKSAVSSKNFDITLLMVLLRNVCSLVPPANGWDTLPPETDTTLEADIVRIKCYRNMVYGHANEASVDDPTFNQYWQDIQDALVRLGGAGYQSAIDDLKKECIDPDFEELYKELLKQWVMDEVSIKERLDEMTEQFGKRLDELEEAIVQSCEKI